MYTCSWHACFTVRAETSFVIIIFRNICFIIIFSKVCQRYRCLEETPHLSGTCILLHTDCTVWKWWQEAKRCGGVQWETGISWTWENCREGHNNYRCSLSTESCHCPWGWQHFNWPLHLLFQKRRKMVLFKWYPCTHIISSWSNQPACIPLILWEMYRAGVLRSQISFQGIPGEREM